MTYTTTDVYCQDSSHNEKPWIIDRFARTGPGEWVTLRELGIRDDGMRTDPHTHQRINELDDTHIGAGPLQAPLSVRNRYKLRCPKCGFSVTVRGERLGVILDQLADAGVSTISLVGLAGILRR